MKLCLVLLFLATSVANGLKILAIFPMPAHSHFTLGFRIVEELASRGHDITFISPYPQKTPIKNVKDISVSSLIEVIEKEVKQTLFDFGKKSYVGMIDFFAYFGYQLTEGTLRNENVQKLWYSNEKFDIILMEHFNNDALAIFAHRFNCPIVYLAPGPATMFNNHLFANPSPSSYIPNLISGFSSEMSLWQRLQNTYFDIVGELFLHLFILPKHNQILHDVFPDAPNLESVLYNGSMLLLTSHQSTHEPYPLQPAMKEIGGYHVKEPKPLPKDLQKILDDAKNGVVIFSMGSNLKSSNFPKEKREAILKSLAKIKQTVLWKFEVDLPEKPDNVKIVKWLPQSDSLAHPNVRAFIGHGGLLGVIESIYHGVPVLGLPVFWDQEQNVEVGSRKGYAICVPYEELTEERFSNALQDILNNPKYLDTARKYSRIIRDEPTKQMDAVVFWLEYVHRHRGAPHLKSPGIKLKWYQRYFIDVVVVVLGPAVILVLVVRKLISSFFKSNCTKKQTSRSKKKN